MTARIDWQPATLHLDLDNERLARGGREIRLTPKAFAMLRYLTEHPAKLLTKQALLAGVWPNTFVVEAQVKHYIRELRAALEDDQTAPQFIETVRGRGYRFIGKLDSGTDAVRCIHPALGDSTAALMRSSTLITPLGREAELRQLQRWLDQALAGERQIGFIMGEPGIGKTLLVEAFLERLAGRGDWWVAGGQCVERSGAGEAYQPVLEALNQLCRGPGGAQVSACLDRYAPLWLLQLPGLEGVDTERLRTRTLGATRERMLRELAQALEALTSERGLVLWLEDLHWADAATLDLIVYLARRRQRARLLVLGTYRPDEMYGHVHPLATLQPELKLRGNCKVLPVPLLTVKTVEDYLALRFPGLPATLAPVLHRHTEGNPLFLVNTVEFLVAQGVIDEADGHWRLRGEPETLKLELPGNLRRLIETQFVKLADTDRRLLEAASISGVTFTAAAVAAGLNQPVEAVEERCAALARVERFVRVCGQECWPDGTLTGRYVFAHALYQTVLYTQATPHRRTLLHRSMGERLEQAYARNSTAIAAELARHFEEGHDDQRAIQYLRQAAATAAQRAAHHEASRHLQRALALLDNLPDSAARGRQELALRVALGVSLMASGGWADAEVEKIYQRVLELCQQSEETSELRPALWGLWLYYSTRAEYGVAREVRERALRLARKLPDQGFLMAAHGIAGDDLFWLGELRVSQRHFEQALALDDPARYREQIARYGLDLGVICRACVARGRWYLGHSTQALQEMTVTLDLARAHQDPFNLAVVLNYAARLYLWRREVKAVQQHAAAALALAHEYGFSYLLGWGTFLLGWVAVQDGQGEQGIAEMRRALAVFKAAGVAVSQSLRLGLLAEAYGSERQIDAGLAALAEAEAFVAAHEERFYEAELYRSRALAAAPVAGGCASLPASGARHRLPAGREIVEARAALDLARLWQAQSQPARSRRLLARVCGRFGASQDSADLQDAKALLEDGTLS
ncbi:MAG: AAA family ATPase [Gammaproteobacteria bacterium]